MIAKLEKEFAGKADVKGFVFTQELNSEFGYLYKVKTVYSTHYEVFRIKTTPVCIDFENHIYSETDFKEVYPKSEAFGTWAWCFTDYNMAINKFNKLKNENTN